MKQYNLSDKTKQILESKNLIYINNFKKNKRTYFTLLCHCSQEFVTRIDQLRQNSMIGCKDCSTKNGSKKLKQTMVKKYGVESYAQTDTSKNRIKKTCLEKYGVESYTQTEEYKQRSKQTCLAKYGVEHYSQTKDYKEKFKNTCIKNYGAEYLLQNKDIKEKKKQTMLDKYGVEHPLHNKIIQEKKNNTTMEKYGVSSYSKTKEYHNQYKQTCLEKYGVEYYTQTEKYKDKTKQTNLKKYGVEHYTQTEEYQTKNKKTCLDKYGVDSYSRSEEYLIKLTDSGNMYTDKSFLTQIQTIKPETNITDVKRIKGKTWEFTNTSNRIWIKKCTSGVRSVTPHEIDQFLSRLNDPNFQIKQLDNKLYEIINLDLNPFPFITKYLKQTYEFDQHFYPEKRVYNLLYKLTYHYQNFEYSFDIQEIEFKYQCEFHKFQEYINYKFVEYYNHSLHECTEQEYNSLQLDHSIPQQFFRKYFPNNWELLANHYTNVKYLKNSNKENQKKSDKYFFNIEKVLQWYSEGNIIFPEHLYNFEEERKIINK